MPLCFALAYVSAGNIPLGPKSNKTPLWVSAFVEYFLCGVVGVFLVIVCFLWFLKYVFLHIYKTLLEDKILQPFI